MSRPAASEPRRPSRTNSPLAGKEILVAESSMRMAELLVSALRSVGVTSISRFTDSSSTWMALSTRRFDAAIVDFNLKPRGAIELTRDLRRSKHENARLPLIGIATNRAPATLTSALMAGMTRVVVRPVSAETLRARLIEVCGNRNAPSSGSGVDEAEDTIEI